MGKEAGFTVLEGNKGGKSKDLVERKKDTAGITKMFWV